MMRVGLRAYACNITTADGLAAEPGVEMNVQQCFWCLQLARSFFSECIVQPIFEFGGIGNAANREAGAQILLNYTPMGGGSN